MLLIQFYTIVGCFIDVYTLEGICTRGDNLAVADFTRGCHTDKLRCSWWPRGGRRDCLSFSAEYNFHSKYKNTLGSRVMTTRHPMGLLYFPFMLCLFFTFSIVLHITHLTCTQNNCNIISNTKAVRSNGIECCFLPDEPWRIYVQYVANAYWTTPVVSNVVPVMFFHTWNVLL